MSDSLKRLADRVGQDPFFLASVLRCYAEANSLNDEALAAQLQCEVGTLNELRLCRNPDAKPPRFWHDVGTIASRFRLNAERLGEIIREGQTFLHLRSSLLDAPTGNAGLLMAARDRAEEPGQDKEE